MEGFDKKEEMNESDSKFNQDIHSRVMRAGKRTYFFDVKSTRRDEYYLTITESKKRFGNDGNYHYEKHKIFLYQEDFEKFVESLQGIIGYIAANQPVLEEKSEEDELAEDEDFTRVEFEDLTN